jgi:hypothetical protein
MRFAVLYVFLFLACSLTLFADVVILQEQVSRTPGGTTTQRLTLKFKGSKARIDIGEMMSSITNQATGERVSLQHPQHKYIKASKSQQKEGLEVAVNQMKDKIPANQPQLTPTKEYKVINGWKARKYIAQGKDSQFEYWMAPELARFKPELEKLHNPMFDQMSRQFPALKPIKGFPVLTISTQTFGSMQIKMTTTVLSIKEVQLPDSDFEIPAGYSPNVH